VTVDDIDHFGSSELRFHVHVKSFLNFKQIVYKVAYYILLYLTTFYSYFSFARFGLKINELNIDSRKNSNIQYKINQSQKKERRPHTHPHPHRIKPEPKRK